MFLIIRQTDKIYFGTAVGLVLILSLKLMQQFVFMSQIVLEVIEELSQKAYQKWRNKITPNIMKLKYWTSKDLLKLIA